MTPALERRAGQPVPTTQAEASARFKCEAYLCTMDGARCRDQHVHAAEFRPLNRDACIDCPAGAARAILLGSGGSQGRAAICQHRMAGGRPCANPPASDGLCHIHRGAAASAKRRTMKTETEKTTTETTRKCGSNAGIDWDNEPRLGKVHPVELAKILGVTATAVRSAAARRGIVYVAPGGEAEEATAEPAEPEAAASAPANPPNNVSTSETPERLVRVVEEWAASFRNRLDAMQRQISGDAGNVDATAARLCTVEDKVGLLEARVDIAAAELADRARSRDEDDDDDGMEITVSLYPVAYNEIMRLARAGLHGYGPADVARTLILEGLRRAGGRP